MLEVLRGVPLYIDASHLSQLCVARHTKFLKHGISRRNNFKYFDLQAASGPRMIEVVLNDRLGKKVRVKVIRDAPRMIERRIERERERESKRESE
jgi:hypothetical protein